MRTANLTKQNDSTMSHSRTVIHIIRVVACFLFFCFVYLLAGATVERVRGRVNALHLVENHSLVREGLVFVLEFVVPTLLLHNLLGGSVIMHGITVSKLIFP